MRKDLLLSMPEVAWLVNIPLRQSLADACDCLNSLHVAGIPVSWSTSTGLGLMTAFAVWTRCSQVVVAGHV